MKIKNTELKVVLRDISKLSVGAVVVPVGFVPRLKPGQAVVARKGKLRAKHFIQVVTTLSSGETNETILRQACRSAFNQAEKLKVSSLAFPAMGGKDFSQVGAAKILAQETLRYLQADATDLKEIIFCLEDAERVRIFQKNLIGYVRHVQEDLGKGPYLTVDAVIELPEGVVLIERSNPPYGWALPGGFVDVGESVETAVAREVKEETGLNFVNPRLLGVYSGPKRDPRFHTVSVVYVGKGRGRARAGDDAKGLRIVPCGELLKGKYAFDHNKIISDYLLKNRKR